jgi:hypothetical protein
MRTAGKLTDVRVRSAALGTHGDGNGLYLVAKQGAGGINRSWLFRYSVGGRSHWTGLGAYPDISLQRARQKAQECRQQLCEGVDPLQHKRDQRAALSQQRTKQAPTFAECATAYIASHEAGWRGKRTGQHWVATLRDHAHPTLGRVSVDEIATEHVLAVLKPLWRTKPETATRPWTHRASARLRESASASLGRESCTVARSPGPPATVPVEGGAGTASSRASLS